MQASESPSALVIHDGELEDVCRLLAGLGTPFTDRRGASTNDDEARAWEMVISTPRRLLEFDSGASGVRPSRIAILEKESRTLRAMLHRAGVDLLVRRPVHSTALRLLLLHVLYRGPEKRRSLRVSVGARVRYRSGIRRRMAVLAELSATGCRLLATDPIERGSRIQVQIPAVVADGRTLGVTGTVVRCSTSDMPGVETVAVSWSSPTTRTAERLRALVASYSAGPAILADEDESDDSSAPQVLRPGTPDEPPPPPTSPSPERRGSDRHEYKQHVIALGVEAARVLLGRDLSIGGMRVEPHADVRLGDEVRIGLHVRAREKPLVLSARVARDEGDRGLVLQWERLDAEARDTLTRMIDYLPVVATREGSDEGSGVVVTEILDHQAGDAR
jgi:hypothetical protein